MSENYFNNLKAADINTIGEDKYRQLCSNVSSLLDSGTLTKEQWIRFKTLLDYKESLIPLKSYEVRSKPVDPEYVWNKLYGKKHEPNS